MGRLIVPVQTTLDGVMDQQEDWLQEQGLTLQGRWPQPRTPTQAR